LIIFAHLSSGHCKSLAPTWDALSKRVEGTNIKVGKINCDENSALCGRYNIQGYPTLLLLKDGDLIADYEGPRSVDSFVSFLNEATAEKKSEGHVVELNSHNFDLATGNPTTRWLIKFFAPWWYVTILFTNNIVVIASR
jgi:thiol-disulfide isomerase/thioredoxin